MHKRILPILFAFIILSCSKPVKEEVSSDTDTVSVVADDVEVVADTIEEEEIEEMIDMRSPVMDVCGFSDDGKYFAFTQELSGEGGTGIAQLFVIDVVKNEWATKPGLVNQVFEDLDSGLLILRTKMLPKYNITYHKNQGKQYDLKDSNKVDIEGKQFDIDLNVINLLVDLHVKGNGKDITLQKDKSLPKSRGAVRQYRLGRANVFNDKIAVFVEYDEEPKEGFEGFRYFERKYIAVTGIVK